MMGSILSCVCGPSVYLLSFYYFLIFLFLLIFLFFILITLFHLFIFHSCVLSFSHTFLLSHVADRVLVLQPGVKPVPLRWESRVRDTGPPETSRLHITSNGESSPRDLHLDAKTELHSTNSKLQCWTPCAKQLARQEHNPTN